MKIHLFHLPWIRLWKSKAFENGYTTKQGTRYIGDAGAKRLADALKSNKTLTKLNLRDSYIGDTGAERLADALKSNKTLTKLNLRDSYILDAGAERLADARKFNKTLTELN